MHAYKPVHAKAENYNETDQSSLLGFLPVDYYDSRDYHAQPQIHTHSVTHIHTHTHTYRNIFISVYILYIHNIVLLYTYAPPHTQCHTHIHTHTYRNIFISIYILFMHIIVLLYTYARTHTQCHTHTHTHMHTHTHTNTQMHTRTTYSAVARSASGSTVKTTLSGPFSRVESIVTSTRSADEVKPMNESCHTCL